MVFYPIIWVLVYTFLHILSRYLEGLGPGRFCFRIVWSGHPYLARTEGNTPMPMAMSLWVSGTRATNWAAPSTTGFGLPRASKLGWGWSYLVGVFFVFEILFNHIWSLVFLAELKPSIIKTKTIWEDDWTTTMTFAGSSQQQEHADAMQFFSSVRFFDEHFISTRMQGCWSESHPQMLGDSAFKK